MLKENFAALLLRVVRIIVQIGILTIFYYMGVGIVSYLHIPLPGSVIGLLLLALSLIFKIIKVEYIQDGASFLIGILTLFFIPATVGVIDYPELMSMTGLLIILAVIASTLISIYITGLLTQIIEKKELAKKENAETTVEEGKGELSVD
ncbi:CidA/LrgA family protein [Lysinibacillus irui]|uniref:CidA/LrgA family protein n=1 Tax=Lysinibacillus irui TaxID=2998077 RepID=A0AAJ5RM86_9BACI|nr:MULTISPECIES: CidA/LrgA family protein [Lysinibacillus]MEA0554281.1 CidA/LrgA family protein [Lysinibacillus irui]MEA0561681.1 CidA/LrgA family protein [Lysinibacillus irui]MEA0974777.1 CidA/LrgA family protein [Lysinibacillus irui]MEA1040931.1 CidA/LrgA family protein [Lysinibacillus irui]WDV07635.1 CidA/LrgA family protein [Lysinibacillus irui]